MFWEVGMGIKVKPTTIIAIMIGFYGCGNENTSNPTPIPTPTPIVIVTPNPNPNPIIVTPNKGYDSWLKNDGSFYIQNLTDQAQTYYAYSYKVYPGGDQHRLDLQKSPSIPPNEVFRGTLAIANCFMQLDLSHQDPSFGEPNRGELGSLLVNRNQFCIDPTPKPTPVPTPTPTPTPNPCQKSWKKCK